MPSYFRQVPDFDYVNRNPKEKNISEYITVKNLFKRGKIRDDIFESVVFFEKYQIIGDERPDNVAYKYYGDESLDWLVLLSKNSSFGLPIDSWVISNENVTPILTPSK